VRAVLVSLLSACALACGAAEPARPRLVVLLAPCTVRRDALAPYDERVRYTPNLAQLARESAVFARHTTESGQSGTDFATMFTGSQADAHGVFYHPRKLPEELELVGEVFAGAGYETWFLSGHGMADADLGYGQGIPPERTLDIRGARKHHLMEAGDGALRRVIDGLAREPARRAFVLANFTSTHEPYHKQVRREAVLEFVRAFPEFGAGVTAAALDRWWPFYEEHRFELEWNLPVSAGELGLSPADLMELARVLEVTYRTAVSGLDRTVGELVDAIRAAGLWDQTVFCFTADHGEALHREGLVFNWTHGLQLAPEVLDVPWLVHAPGVAPQRYEGVTRSIDVLPTLAGLCGIHLAPRPGRDGQDLTPVLLGRAAPPELLAFSHTSVVGAFSFETFAKLRHVLRFYPRTDPKLCWVRVRSGDLVVEQVNAGEESWRTQAFDLARDPLERQDLFDAKDARQSELAGKLAGYKQRLVEAYARTQGAEAQTPEALDRLRELGYVGTEQEERGSSAKPR
jgi:arylsulfatase A-like enzyme